jgi:predicted Ser/Thr protein kinase
MAEAFTYEPNSLAAVLSRIETNVKVSADNLLEFRSETKEAYASLHKKLEEHATDITTLKASEGARDKQIKKALVLGGVLIAGGQLLIEWIRHTS